MTTAPPAFVIPGRRVRSTVSAPADAAIGYLRVSTDQQVGTGHGLAAQRAAIEQAAERKGLTVIEWHTDAGISGGVAPADRPGMAAALAAMADRRAAVMMAAKLDRLSRSTRDAGELLDRADAEGWQLFTADLDIDTTTPTGEAAAGMMTVFSQLERRLISQRTREALAALKAQGVQLGQPTKVPDEVLARIARETAEGASLRAIAAGLMADGIPTGSGSPTWHAAQVRRALNCQRGQAIAQHLYGDQTTEGDQ